jgi:hypothetical protein
MPTVPVPLFTPTYRNVDETELSDQTAYLIDGYLDELGFSRSRPGLSQSLDIGLGINNPVSGLFWWPHKTYVVAVANGNLYKIERSSGTLSATILSGDTLSSDLPVSFATDGTRVFAASDGRIVYSDGTGAGAAYMADADVPTSVSHVGYLDGYLLCNNLTTNKFHHSDVNDSLNFAASNFFSASGNADYITALHVFNREIFLFGPSSLEVWENDGVAPFSRVAGGFIEVGCIAPYSIAILVDKMFWLDNHRYFHKYENGRLDRISTPYDKDIQGYTTVSDCVAHRIEIAGKSFIAFKFPTEGKTLVYDTSSGVWSEWGYWDISSMSYKRWLGASHCYAPDWGLHLVGDRKDSLIHEMGESYYDDNGNPLRMNRRTGHIDYGTLKRKHSKALRLRLRRGGGELTTRTPKITLRWRDNGPTEWSNEKEIDLGDIGEREIVKEFRNLGIYRTRQYEIVASDPVPIVYGKAEEDIEVLDETA